MNWQEGSTKLGPTNMNHIETGIDEATDTAEAAVPKTTVTTAGDIIYGTGAGAVTRLGIGTARQMLITNSGATAPSWVASPQSLMTGTGDMIYSSSANTPARLAAGTNGQVLTVAGGVPTWAASTGIVITKYSKITEKDVNTTVTKTDLLNGEITIGANALSSSGAIVIDCGGKFKNDTGATRKLTLELKLGSTVLWDSNASDNINQSSVIRAWHFKCAIQSLGATNSQRGSGIFLLCDTNAAATTGTGHIGANDQLFAAFETVAGTEDMTSSKALTLSVTLSASSADLSMQLEHATILVY